mmetsp:Transcript_21224/g.82348  ORF Transcript_21224/g.82348 Transcript_21224/m.82348 type:complete len:417 (-) Transcript_21224:29-1279(-)
MAVLLAALTALNAAEHERAVEDQLHAGCHLCLEARERGHVQRVEVQALAKGSALERKVLSEQVGSLQQRAAREGVVDARDVEHGRDRAHALALLAHEERRRVMELKLCRGHALRAELVLEADHLDTAVLAVAVVREGGQMVGLVRRGGVLVLHVDVEEREAPAAGLRAAVLLHDPSQRKCHCRRRGGSEELVAVQCVDPRALAAKVCPHLAEGVSRQLLLRRKPGQRARFANVRASRPLSHPLAAGGKHLGIARYNAGQRALLQRRVARQLYQARRPVRHREGAADDGYCGEEVDLAVLVEPAVLAMRALVPDGNEALLGGCLVEAAPGLVHLDLVHTLAPGADVDQLGRVALAEVGVAANVAHHTRPEGRQLFLEVSVDLHRHQAPQDRAESAVLQVGIRQLRRRLREALHPASF